MPQVPKTPDASRIQSSGYNGQLSVRASGSGFDGGISNALGNLANSVNRFAEKQMAKQEEFDRTEVKEAEIQFNKELSEVQNEFLSTQGKNTVEGYDAYEQSLDKLRSKYSGTLKTEDQRRAFDMVATNRITTATSGASRYRTQQEGVWKDSVSEARISQAIDNASSNYNNDYEIRANIDAGVLEIKEMAARQGWDKEVTDSKIKAYTASVHGTVINRYMSGEDFVGAKEYFDIVEDTLNDKQRDEYSRKITSGLEDQEADNLFSSLYSSDLTIDESVAMIREEGENKNYSQDVIDNAISRAKVQKQIDLNGEAERNQKLFSSAYDVVTDPTKTIKDIDASVWAELTPSQKENLKKINENRVGPDKSNMIVYQNLYRMNPEEFVNVNIAQDYAKDLSYQHQQEMIRRQESFNAELSGGSNSGSFDFSGASAQKKINETWDRIYALDAVNKPKEDSKEYSEAFINFRTSMEIEVRDWQIANKRKIDAQTLNGMLNLKVFSIVEEDGGFAYFDRSYSNIDFVAPDGVEIKKDSPLYGIPKQEISRIASQLSGVSGREVNADDIKIVYNDFYDISPTRRDAIANSLRKTGVPVNEYNIVQRNKQIENAYNNQQTPTINETQ